VRAPGVEPSPEQLPLNGPSRPPENQVAPRPWSLGFASLAAHPASSRCSTWAVFSSSAPRAPMPCPAARSAAAPAGGRCLEARRGRPKCRVSGARVPAPRQPDEVGRALRRDGRTWEIATSSNRAPRLAALPDAPRPPRRQLLPVVVLGVWVGRRDVSRPPLNGSRCPARPRQPAGAPHTRGSTRPPPQSRNFEVGVDLLEPEIALMTSCFPPTGPAGGAR